MPNTKYQISIPNINTKYQYQIPIPLVLLLRMFQFDVVINKNPSNDHRQIQLRIFHPTNAMLSW